MSGVYVITDGGHFKIGLADDPMKRLRELQTGNPRQLRLVFFVESRRSVVVERSAHEKLAHLRTVGEWFACETDCAISAVLNAIYPEPGDVLEIEMIEEEDGQL